MNAETWQLINTIAVSIGVPLMAWMLKLLVEIKTGLAVIGVKVRDLQEHRDTCRKRSVGMDDRVKSIELRLAANNVGDITPPRSTH